MAAVPDEVPDLASELRLIREAINRYRRSTFYSFILSSLTVVALVLSVTVGAIAWASDQNNAERDQRNLIRLVRSSCEDGNDRAVRNAEVLISVFVDQGISAEGLEMIERYREGVQDSLTDCDERVAIIAGD